MQRFYALLNRLHRQLQGTNLLARCSGVMGWPRRGVYFFFEPDENRSGGGPRVVRVGTHALKSESKSSLWQRLSQHRGTSSGGGNHRGSIFRLLVGEALKGSGKYASALSWDSGNNASKKATQLGISREQVRLCEQPLEIAVSDHIRSMPFLWINIDDEPGPGSDRGVIERNSIALLSNHGKAVIDPPSGDWLGRHCSRELVRSSGLWNNKHVKEQYDSGFLSLLERYIESTTPLRIAAT
ncbi:MAG: hypothetical protein ACKO26_13820 [Planctomycetota bacterium]